MADKDISRRSVERAMRVIDNAKGVLQSRFPYGPDKMKLSRSEARRMIQRMNDPQWNSFQQTLGPEQWQDLMRDLYGS